MTDPVPINVPSPPPHALQHGAAVALAEAALRAVPAGAGGVLREPLAMLGLDTPAPLCSIRLDPLG